MNAERLHAVANAMLTELRDTDTTSTLEGMANAFRQLPGDPAQQQTVADLRRQLEERLSEAPSNDFSPAWRRALEELHVADLFGSRLLASVEGILTRTEMTPVAAADELQPIADNARGLENALSQLQTGFDFLDIGAEVLGPSEFEVGFLIPRDEVHEDLDELAKEFHQLSLILVPFRELSGERGSMGEFRVRSISSSDFGVFLELAPVALEMFFTGLQGVLAAYERWQMIRAGNREYQRAGGLLKEETLEEIQEQVDNFMAKELGVVAKELMASRRRGDSGRAHELETHLAKSLNGIANRVDRKYTIEVRAPELPAPDDEIDGKKPNAKEKRARQAAQTINGKEDRLAFPAPDETQAILALPEPTGTRRRTAARKTTTRKTTTKRTSSSPTRKPKDEQT